VSVATYTPEMGARITALLSEWKLPTAAGELVRRLVAGGHGEALLVVAEVLELEAAGRKERRTDRLRRASKLPPGKTFDTLDKARVPPSALLRVQELSRGEFVDHAGNVLLFGMPGVGKSHLACALGHALVEAGRSVLFTPTYQLVQQLLAARRDLSLPRALRALDVFDAILLDDLGYVQQTAEEAEVLFTLMAERYERWSLIREPDSHLENRNGLACAVGSRIRRRSSRPRSDRCGSLRSRTSSSCRTRSDGLGTGSIHRVVPCLSRQAKKLRVSKSSLTRHGVIVRTSSSGLRINSNASTLYISSIRFLQNSSAPVGIRAPLFFGRASIAARSFAHAFFWRTRGRASRIACGTVVGLNASIFAWRTCSRACRRASRPSVPRLVVEGSPRSRLRSNPTATSALMGFSFEGQRVL
jgi:DNA replication protein DnaC